MTLSRHPDPTIQAAGCTPADSAASQRPQLNRRLAVGLTAAGLSRWQITLLAVGSLLALYAVLWGSVGSIRAAAGPEAQAAPEQQVPTQSQPDPAGTDAQPELDGQPGAALGADFLSEFDRLSGDEAQSEVAAVPVSDSDTSSLATNLGFSLLIVLGLAYAGIWGYKQFVQRRGGAGVSTGHLMSVQESRALGANQMLHLVRLGDELLLLGATDHAISCLARYGSEGLIPETFSEHLTAQMHPGAHGRGQSTAAVSSGGTPAQPTTLHQSLQELRSSQSRRGGFGG